MKQFSEKIDNEEYKSKLFEFSQSKNSIFMREQYCKKANCYKNTYDYYANLKPDKKSEIKKIFILCVQYEYEFFNEVYKFNYK